MSPGSAGPCEGLLIAIVRCCVSAFVGLAVSIGGSVASEIPYAARQVIDSDEAGAWDVESADLDGDGDLDVLAANRVEGTVVWYENLGSATPAFAKHVLSGSAGGAVSVAAADLDGDGDLDAIAAAWGADKIEWYENDSGTPPGFTIRTVSAFANGVRALRVADLDRDSDPDVVAVLESSGTVLWYENDGAIPPGFTANTISADEAGASAVHVADVDGDGDPDVVSSAIGADRVTWFENDGTTPPAFTPHVVTTDVLDPRAVASGDIDRDGDLDLLVASEGDDTVAWLVNDGASPPVFSKQVIAQNAIGAYDVAALDLDRDGDLDVLSASAADDRIVWYENDTDAGPAFIERTITAAADAVRSVVAVDLTGDGDIDVLSASSGDDSVAWHDNETIHRGALFPEPVPLATPGDEDLVRAGDIDGDGDLDLVLSSDVDPTLSWLESSGGTSPTFTLRPIQSGPSTGGVALADLDGDGDLDVVAAANVEDSVTWHDNVTGDGDSWTARSVVTSIDQPWGLGTADLDRDGDVDVIVGASDEIGWYENDGNVPPSFAPHTVDTGLQWTLVIVPTDVDGDGDVDIVTEGPNSTVAWYENLGTVVPSFQLHVLAPNVCACVEIAAAGDLDRDGDVDILGISAGEAVWLENGGSSFSQHSIYSDFFDDPIFVHEGDVDLDGDLDVLVGTYGYVRVFANDGGVPPSFMQVDMLPEPLAGTAILADLDGDGDPDIVTPSLVSADAEPPTAWWPNRGGQFGLRAVPVGDSAIPSGTSLVVLTIEAGHRGRAGDADARLHDLRLRFEDAGGSPLSSSEVEAVVDALSIYGDDGSGELDPAIDVLLSRVDTFSLNAGVLTVPFPAGEPLALLAPEAVRTYFVVVENEPGTGADSDEAIVITNLPGTATDVSHGIALSPELVSTSTGNLWIGFPKAGAISGASLNVERLVGGHVSLGWGPSCLLSDGDFVVYEGELGEFTSHAPRVCGTGGNTSQTIWPSAGNRYYLVVPRSDLVEGSHGRNGDGVERAPGQNTCRPQGIGSCG